MFAFIDVSCRYRGAALIALGLALAAPRVASANPSHSPDLPRAHATKEVRAWWLRKSASTIVDADTRMDERHHYQGLALAGQRGWEGVSAKLVLPTYHTTGTGPGLSNFGVDGILELLPAHLPVGAGIAVDAASTATVPVIYASKPRLIR